MGVDAEDSKGVTTPHNDTEVDETPLTREDEIRFRATVARLNYLAQDRSDIQFTVKELCRFMSKPTQEQLTKLKRVGRYLKMYPTVAIHYDYQKKPEELNVWTDSDHAGCKITRKSTS